MRLVIDKNQQYSADYKCTSARDGQRILNERPISMLYIGQSLEGRKTGLDVLRWAKQKNRLPLYVMITTNVSEHRKILGEFLNTNGFIGDGIFFRKTIH
ncbi:hypothetical protein NBRC116493_10140 [Aurantivibrio infirmus]